MTVGANVVEYMEDCRGLVRDELQRFLPSARRCRSALYDLVLDYPLREAKGLRPSICIATCRALGGSLEGVTTSAAVLELYHNAFLIHDDVEDGSELRRDAPALHRAHGVAVAINVGDAMLALALDPLLDNMRVLSVGKALRILQTVARMARESAEGQAMELAFIREANWALSDRDYLRLVHKKTTYYTFLAPMVVGAIVAGAGAEHLYRLRLFATALGAAFQIQDDILNLTGEQSRTGKETAGDLWEGKHTLMLLHAIRQSTPRERRRARDILAKARPTTRSRDELPIVSQLAERLRASGDLSSSGYDALRSALRACNDGRDVKTEEDVAFLRDLIERRGSIRYARSVAHRRAEKARKTLAGALPWMKESAHRRFLAGLADFVTERDH
jgi:geranylgeranyl diphosphate synthase type II